MLKKPATPSRSIAEGAWPARKRRAKTYTTLPDTVWLRTADCLHLVTSMHHGFTEIFTYDRNQSAVAASLGLKANTA